MLKKNSIPVLILTVLLILVVPATACSVLTATNDCDSVFLEWTAWDSPATAGYAVSVDGSLYFFGYDDFNADIPLPPGTYEIVVIPFNSFLTSECVSNPVTVTIPESCVSSPEFPSMFIPAAMIIGILGAMLLIQRTRE